MPARYHGGIATIRAVFTPIPEILDELRAGRIIVLTDDEDRENEGDLVLPAQFVTPELISFMLREASGYLFLSLTEADCDRLDLHDQTPVNTSVRGTPLTVSIDGHPKHGFTTGVSAHERAKSIHLAIDPDSGPDDFVRPGHINPLRSRDGGVLVRIGQTEGSVDLCRLAGLYPAAVGIEIMREDGEMARLPDLERFCAQHDLKMCSVRDIIEHRLAKSSIVERLDPKARHDDPNSGRRVQSRRLPLGGRSASAPGADRRRRRGVRRGGGRRRRRIGGADARARPSARPARRTSFSTSTLRRPAPPETRSGHRCG